MSSNGPMLYRRRPRGRHSKLSRSIGENNDIFFECDVCKKGSPSHRPCQPDTYPAKPLEGNYHLGQSYWVDGVIQSGQTYAFDKAGRRHNLTFHPGAKSSYNTLRKNLVKWRYRAFGSSKRIKELSRSEKYTFTMADQAHWHQQTDTSIPDPVARRNVVTLKDTQGGFHEIFVLTPTPENETEARKMWVRTLCRDTCGPCRRWRRAGRARRATAMPRERLATLVQVGHSASISP